MGKEDSKLALAPPTSSTTEEPSGPATAHPSQAPAVSKAKTGKVKKSSGIALAPGHDPIRDNGVQEGQSISREDGSERRTRTQREAARHSGRLPQENQTTSSEASMILSQPTTDGARNMTSHTPNSDEERTMVLTAELAVVSEEDRRRQARQAILNEEAVEGKVLDTSEENEEYDEDKNVPCIKRYLLLVCIATVLLVATAVGVGVGLSKAGSEPSEDTAKSSQGNNARDANSSGGDQQEVIEEKTAAPASPEPTSTPSGNPTTIPSSIRSRTPSFEPSKIPSSMPTTSLNQFRIYALLSPHISVEAAYHDFSLPWFAETWDWMTQQDPYPTPELLSDDEVLQRFVAASFYFFPSKMYRNYTMLSAAHICEWNLADEGVSGGFFCNNAASSALLSGIDMSANSLGLSGAEPVVLPTIIGLLTSLSKYTLIAFPFFSF